jgi:hypothetical protein
MRVIISWTGCSVLYVYYSYVRDKNSQIGLFGLSCSCDDFINTSRTKFNGDVQKKSDIYPYVKDKSFSLLPSAQFHSERTGITVMLDMYCIKAPGLNLCMATAHKAMFSETGTPKEVLLAMQITASNQQIFNEGFKPSCVWALRSSWSVGFYNTADRLCSWSD